MPAAEPHPRRRAAWRALATVLASVVVLSAVPGAPAGAGQLLPTTTTEPSPATTEPEPELTTTTTEAEPAPTTTDAPRATTTTGRASVQDDEVDREGDGAVGDAGDQVDDTAVDGPVEDEAPAETTSTARDLLVGGDGTDGAESTTTTSTTVVEVAADDGTLDEEAQIWLIVAGLVAVAALIGVWTWRYWVRTRPVPIEGGPDDTTVFPG
jgi:cobalamin biosynthesis Mg chelatase CobN